MSVTEILSHLNRLRGKEQDTERMMTEHQAHVQYHKDVCADCETIIT